MGVPPGTVPLALLAAMEKAGDPRSGPCLRNFGHVFPVPFVGHSGLLVPSEGPLPEEVREQASICECRDLAPGAEYLLVRVRLREYLRRHEAAGRWTVVGENATARAASSFGMCLPAGCAGEDGSAPSAALRAVVLWFVFLAGAGLPVDVADAPPLRLGDVSTRRCCRPRDAGGDSLAHHFGGGRGAARDDYVVVGAGAFCPRLGPRPAVPGGRAPRVFATYVSPRRQMYRDGAVLLGLALQRHAPEVPRLALVEDLGSARGYGATLLSLEAAGWHVWPVAARQPPLAPETSLVGSYAKIEVWRVDADEVVYLDSDSWVRSPLVLEMFDALRDSPVAMVRNCYWDTREQQYNGGVIALRPDLQKFATLDSYLMPGIHNDQWAINGVYERGEIRELPARFNVHCSLVQEGLTSAEEAVVVHFTGLVQSADGSATGKPALAHPGVLRQVRHGRGLLYGAIHGGAALYSEYFEEMLAVAPSGLLSAELRAALQEAVAVG